MTFEPEISRRCSACGASVRARARFCPQCGREVARAVAPPDGAPDPALAPAFDVARVEPITAEDEVVRPEMLRAAAKVTEAEEGRAVERTQLAGSAENRILPAAVKSEDDAASAAKAAARGARSITTIQEAAADTRFGVTPHVERLRQASTVVLDEAADDPEVRFLLVAAFLFVVFVVVLIVTSVLK